MARVGWHWQVNRVVNELSREYDCDLLKPSRVYFRTDEDVALLYQPDSVWVYGRKDLDLTIWEIESAPAAKTIAGDISLASESRSVRAEMYPYKGLIDRPMVISIRKPVTFRGMWDRRQTAITIDSEDYELLPRPKYVSFILVLREEDDYTYYRRYLDVISKRRPRPFDFSAAICCPFSNPGDIGRSLSNSGVVKAWDIS